MAIERTKGRVGVFTIDHAKATTQEDFETVLREVADRHRLEPRLEEYERLANEILADHEASEPCKFFARSMLLGIERIKEWVASGNAEMAALYACNVGEHWIQASVNKLEKRIMSQSTAGKASHVAEADAITFAQHIAKNTWKEDPTIRKADMIKWVNGMLAKAKMETFSDRRLWDKIKDLAPAEIKKPGRPTKN